MKRIGISFRLFMAAVFFAGSVTACFGQQAVASADSDQSSALRSFEAAADQEYELGSGDQVTIDVNGRPELSGKHIIGPDGRVTLSVAGDLELAGETRTQAAKAIQTALSPYYQNITVSLSVDSYTSNHVLIVGAVEHPGLMTFDGTPTLLEVIARSGPAPRTVSSSLNSTSATTESLAPNTVPERCIVYRKGQAVLTVQLRKLLRDGDPLINLRLRRDDMIFVPGESPYVSVLGNVSHAGLVRLDSTSTLPQLLAASGGLIDKAGRNPKILIVHAGVGTAPGGVETVAFQDVLDPKPMNLVFRSGDIIYVPESGFNRTADSLQKISPLLTLITLGALLN